jgi:UBX domain-containing protein 1
MDGKLAEFATVTGCADADKARFFLESAAGDVAAAVEAFFEHGEGEGAPGSEDPAPGSGAPEGPGAAPVAAAAASPAARPTRSTRSTRAAGKGNVRGFGDLGKTSDGGGDDDDDEPTEWYTGGAASGSVVQDPTKRKNPVGADRMRAALDGAREHGAVDGTREDLETRTGAGVSGASSFGGAFVGSGRTLGSTAAEASVPSAAAAKETADAPSSAAEAPQTHVVTFWSNGFTVNDGPLRAYDDPRNTPFMEAVSKGQCPPELVPANPTTPININLVRKDADYEPPPEPKYVAFSGAGRTLASPPSPTAAPPEIDTAPPDPAKGTAKEKTPFSGEWSCDDSKPSASVQLRLRDGSRKVAKFNLTHTVRDVRAFIASAAPAAAGDGNYALQLAGFPPERLDDEARAVGDGLAGAVIIQR